jgi:hypothetical protein
LFGFNHLGPPSARGQVQREHRQAVMHPDVVGLRDFYNRPLGGVVRRLLTSRIRARWRSVEGSALMGLGFAVPYIGMFRGEASRLGALMPASQGAIACRRTARVAW